MSLVTVNRIGGASPILPEASASSTTQADSVKAEVRRSLQARLSEAEFRKVDSVLTFRGGGGKPGIIDMEHLTFMLHIHALMFLLLTLMVPALLI